MLTDFIQYLVTLPWLELIAMLLSLAYVILAARGSLWCWPAAFVSTAIYSYIFYDVLLLMDSALNAYYLLMAVYGYWAWQKSGVDNTAENIESEKSQFSIVSWKINWHIKACSILSVVSLALGYIMANYTPADFPYIDTFTTVFAVFATYLVAQRVLENWLYWLIIDAVSIYLYIEKDLMPTAVLFIIYIVIATYGYFKWLHIYKNNSINLVQPIVE